MNTRVELAILGVKVKIDSIIKVLLIDVLRWVASKYVDFEICHTFVCWKPF